MKGQQPIDEQLKFAHSLLPWGLMASAETSAKKRASVALGEQRCAPCGESSCQKHLAAGGAAVLSMRVVRKKTWWWVCKQQC